MNDSCLLAVFAKHPQAGQAKTRLAQETSAAWAQRVAQAMLEDSLDRFSQVQTHRAIVFAPPTSAAFFAELANNRYRCVPQQSGDLGQRLSTLFAAARAEGFSRIVALGADSPTVPIEYIERAFAMLENHDVVLGPAFDGGYYLIGCGVKEYPVFESIPWSTPGVLQATVERLHGFPARLALLPPWYDIDSATDWAMLRGHVLALRRAGIDLETPRLLNLIQEPAPPLTS